ncbi:MAG TPA: flagellar filament capping protein FliD [Pyrinomonadaceae bacterium]|jgi:flagellar hook-associated protein 2|nr:flagellar filament capping protein FliD [Pyrinomonadaceae bacterium]
MATVNFSGIGSGIDFSLIRDAILSQRSVPITQLQTKVSSYNSRMGALRQLNTLLATLTTASQALTGRDVGTGRTGTATDESIATAIATSQATLGGFEVNVTRIATALTQSSRSYGSTSEAVLAGGATTATFELRKGGAATGTPITIDSSNNTLTGLRDAINNANAGVTATIVDITGDGTQQKLVLSSAETGAVGRVELVETTAAGDTGTLADMGLTSINPADNDFSKLDASLSINGLNITRSNNTISDAVSGVTLSLKKAGTTTINITQSSDVETKLKSFVDAYNAVQDLVATQYTKDASGRPTGVLAGDTTLRSVQQQLRGALNTISETNGGSLETLSEIGLTAAADGHLKLDSTVLNEKLQTNAADVRALLYGATASDTGIFQGIHKISSGMSDAATGSIQSAITGYESSIRSMNTSISKKMEAIARLRESLTRQFAAVDAAIGQINSQGTALSSIMTSLQNASNK